MLPVIFLILFWPSSKSLSHSGILKPTCVDRTFCSTWSLAHLLPVCGEQPCNHHGVATIADPRAPHLEHLSFDGRVIKSVSMIARLSRAWPDLICFWVSCQALFLQTCSCLTQLHTGILSPSVCSLKIHPFPFGWPCWHPAFARSGLSARRGFPASQPWPRLIPSVPHHLMVAYFALSLPDHHCLSLIVKAYHSDWPCSVGLAVH